VTAVEVSEGKHLDEALVKSLTGAETIAARLLYRETFEFRPQFKIWLAANYRPEIRGRDHAIWRRVHLLPFSVQIPDSEKDADLPTKLRAELPGVLAWAVEGCLEWQRDGLNPPAEVHEATQSYKAEMDTMGAILGDRCIEVQGASSQASPLYRAYCEWAAANNEPLLSSTKFGREMTNRFAKVKDARGLIRYAGIMLRNDGSEALGGFEEANSNSLHEGVITESSRNGH
jgi:putative DNA primase/helicase